MRSLPRNTILLGDATARLAELPSASVDCAITSPPYYQLRDYGTSGQLGLEESVDAWAEQLRVVLAEVARVLKPTGSLWLNLGDAFSRHTRYGAPPKSLLCAPERLLLALVRDGWIVRNKVIWAKTNPMPSSVTDRLSLTYEVVYFLVRSPRYFFDLDAIREPHRSQGSRSTRPRKGKPTWAGPLAASTEGLRRARAAGQPGHALGKNPGDVWPLATRGYRGAHFATFPPDVVRRPVLATCPKAICTACARPWHRQSTIRRLGLTASPHPGRSVLRSTKHWHTVREVGDLVPCGCDAPTQPGVVLDPFFGTGTVGVVARQIGRDWLGIELNPAYVAMAWDRLGGTSPRPYERAAPLAVAA